jgi:response regulator RpfG family c-di-GMP phosphodiesterase/tRNA A-37 threonylcarbamoyl transferase component Bud32
MGTGDAQSGLGLGAPNNLSLSDFLNRLIDSRLLTLGQLEQFLKTRPDLTAASTLELAQTLIAQGLLTDFQLARIYAGQTFGLVLGNYRIVERLGAGGMGVVYKAEHLHMKRAVAIKVLVADEADQSIFLQRFYSEMQATAVLSHPNIVLAFDAGEVAVPNSANQVLHYLVMECVQGQNLEQLVFQQGPLSVERACEYIRQAASGLQHAYEHGLVHRDIKPSNLFVTPQSQVKILDFGLARLSRRRHTEAHAMLGSIDYMAPEQARDARSVDIRADIYGLGGTLYWLLSGRKPFPGERSPIEELVARQKETPPPLRNFRPGLPRELEAIVQQMMALDPNHRYPTPLAVMSALAGFGERAGGNGSAIVLSGGRGPNKTEESESALPVAGSGLPVASARILLVIQSSKLRATHRAFLETQGLECREARTAEEALEVARSFAADAVVIDAQLPGNSGLDLCSSLRAQPPVARLRLLLLTPENTPDWLASGQSRRVDDSVPQSVHPQELAARVRLALRSKEADERADQMAVDLLEINQQLQQALHLRDADLQQAQDVLIFAMARMAELRGLETGAHLMRMQAYVRCLAEEAMQLPAFAQRIDDQFVRMVERCVLLHDIGKVAIPDHILLKPGKLEPEERSVMESHTVVAADILAAVARQHGAPLPFLQMATEIARHHHERFDGSGYPSGLAGEAIPLSARLVTVADVYDALRSKLVYKPGLAHGPARRLILESNPVHFDPALLVAFRNCEANFEQVFAQMRD